MRDRMNGMNGMSFRELLAPQIVSTGLERVIFDCDGRSRIREYHSNIGCWNLSISGRERRCSCRYSGLIRETGFVHIEYFIIALDGTSSEAPTAGRYRDVGEFPTLWIG